VSREGFRIRAGGAEDLARVFELERRVVEAPHWGLGEYRAVLNADGGDDGAVRRCLMIAEAPDGRLLGFAVGKMVGFVMEGVGEIESVAVDLGARRVGVGRALCAAVIGWCRLQGVGVVELEVRASSGGAIALYGRLGFVLVGRRKEYYREPVEDALLLKLGF
jgi:ribosomal-protein-alanine N-acetyltransferase